VRHTQGVIPPNHPTRYAASAGPEGEYQPGSGRRVLRNLLGITRKRRMDVVEYHNLAQVQAHYLRRVVTNDTRFTVEFLCQMHRDWLGSVYSWAGRYRSVELAKGAFQWPPAYLVAQNMERLELGLLRAHTPCRPTSIEVVARRLAEVHAELMLIHPFRDGNGRLGRWLADLMAMQAGLPAPSPAYGFSGLGSSKRRDRYVEAVSEGYVGNYRPLEDFFALALELRLR
jgi:cell filamentation protein